MSERRGSPNAPAPPQAVPTSTAGFAELEIATNREVPLLADTGCLAMPKFAPKFQQVLPDPDAGTMKVLWGAAGRAWGQIGSRRRGRTGQGRGAHH